MLLGGFDGPQSALRPGGQDAAQLYLLFIVMLVGAVVLWLALNGLLFYFTRVNRQQFALRHGNRIIIGAGAILPTVVVGGLLAWALPIMPSQPAPGDGLVIRVTGAAGGRGSDHLCQRDAVSRRQPHRTAPDGAHLYPLGRFSRTPMAGGLNRPSLLHWR